MPHPNAHIAHALYDAFNERDFERALELLAPGFTPLNVTTGEVFEGGEGNLRFLNGWATAFPDARADVEHVVGRQPRITTTKPSPGALGGGFRPN